MPPKISPREAEYKTWFNNDLRLVIKDGSDTARFGQVGALNANENDGAMNVNRNRPENLENSYANEGGRAAEVVHTKKDARLGVFFLWFVFKDQDRFFAAFSFSNCRAFFQFLEDAPVGKDILLPDKCRDRARAG